MKHLQTGGAGNHGSAKSDGFLEEALIGHKQRRTVGMGWIVKVERAL